MPLFPIAVDAATEAHLTAAARHELLILRSRSTGEHREPCAVESGADGDLEWVTASGHGTIVSWSVAHLGGAEHLFGIVELAEGPWLWVELRGGRPWAELTGRAVQVEFAATGADAATIPVFRLLD